MNTKFSFLYISELVMAIILAGAVMAPGAHAVSLPPGTQISVSITDKLDSGVVKSGQTLSGILAGPVVVNGRTDFGRGTPVSGGVVQAISSGLLKKPASLTLQLTQLGGSSVSTDPLRIDGKSHLARNAEFIGGGTAAGAVIGTIAGGTKGGAIGPATGAGAGTTCVFLTGKKEIAIPSTCAVPGGNVSPTTTIGTRRLTISRPPPTQSNVPQERRVGHPGETTSQPYFSEGNQRLVRRFYTTNTSNLPKAWPSVVEIHPNMRKKALAVQFAILLNAAIVISPTASQSLGPQHAMESLIEEHFSQGQQAMKRGRYDQAAREFEEVLKLDPGLSQAHINLGLALHLLGDYARAATELEEGLKNTPNIIGGNIVLGIDELRLGHPSRSISPLKRALSLNPSNQQALQTLAAAYVALENYLEANRTYCAAFSRRPEQAEDWLKLGKAYLGMAKQLGARIVHNYPDSSWVDRLAGDLLCERQRWNDAARKYESAIAHDPRQPGLHASLGKGFLMQGKFEDAKGEFQSELQLDPNNPSALLGLAEIDLVHGQSRTALSAIQQLAEVSPGFLAGQSDFPAIKISPLLAARMTSELVGNQPQMGLHYLLGALYDIGGQTMLAHQEQAAFQSDLKRFSEHKTTNRGSRWVACNADQNEACERLLDDKHKLDSSQYEALGRAHFVLRDYGKASDAFASALAQNASDPSLTYWLSRTYIELAGLCFTQLDKLFPGSPQAHEFRAESYQMTGADEEAVREYEFALKMEPQEASLYQALGEIALKQKNLATAERVVHEALVIDPTSARSLYLMGRVAIGTQHPEDAVLYLRKALHYDPSYLPAHASLGIAYLHAGRPASAVEELEQSASLDIYGDLHYMLYKAYRELEKPELAKNALAVSESLRRKTAAADLAKLSSLEGK